MFRSAAITLALCLATGTAQAALLGRAALTPGGTDYQAYYDDVLNITWLADATLSDTNNFGVAGINGNGTMSWTTAGQWIAAINAASYHGLNNWRLPTVIDTGAPGCNYAWVGTDCGWNVDLSTSEMAHMFYSTLGVSPAYDVNGTPADCTNAQSPPYCLTNTGPFLNFESPYRYWSGTADAAIANYAWRFDFSHGAQSTYYQTAKDGYAWPILDGDPFSVVPIPPAVWLFGSALGLMGVMRRKVSG
jgi:hypothetical protein